VIFIKSEVRYSLLPGPTTKVRTISGCIKTFQSSFLSLCGSPKMCGVWRDEKWRFSFWWILVAFFRFLGV